MQMTEAADGTLFLFTSVTSEVAGGGKFAQLVAYHKFGYIHRNKLIAVVYRKGLTYKVGGYGRAAAPRFDHPFFTFALGHSFYFLFELGIYVRAFFNGTGHV